MKSKFSKQEIQTYQQFNKDRTFKRGKEIISFTHATNMNKGIGTIKLEIKYKPILEGKVSARINGEYLHAIELLLIADLETPVRTLHHLNKFLDEIRIVIPKNQNKPKTKPRERWDYNLQTRVPIDSTVFSENVIRESRNPTGL